MRSSLLEAPVLLTMLWGGLVSGAASGLFRLPKLMEPRSHKGKRAGFFKRAAYFFADILAAACLAFGFALTLIRANGGVLRLYAVCGFFLAAWLAGRVLRGLVLGK